MILGKGIALDANILIRAVLGVRVLALLKAYEGSVTFYTPDVCFDEARRNLPRILSSRGGDPKKGIVLIDQIGLLVQLVNQPAYLDFEQAARERMAARDIEDWPIVAVALMLSVPVWTEDRDYFGSGVATWTTDRVELYLQGRHG